MKRTWGILATSAVLGLVGCASDGTFNTAQNGTYRSNAVASTDWHNPNAAGTAGSDVAYDANRADLNRRDVVGQDMSDQRISANDTSIRRDQTITGQVARDPNEHHADVNGRQVPPANMTDMANAGSDNDVQLRHGNDKTVVAAALNTDDRNFLQTAASSDMYELQASQKAVAKSSDAHVKDLAQHMIDDHTKTSDHLTALAKRKGVEVSTLPTPDQTNQLAKLDSLNGTDFDREFVNQQIQAHQKAIDAFDAESTNGHDRDVKEFAANTLPKLRDHLRMFKNEPENNLGSER